MIVTLFFSGQRALAAGPLSPQPDASEEAANDDNPQVTEAREIFRGGVDAAREGHWQDALAAFEKSNRLRPHVVTLYNIGFCERRLGHDTRARQALIEALKESDTPGVAHLPEAMSTAAKTELDAIRTELATAAMGVRIPGVKVLVDGRPLERSVSVDGKPTFVAGTREPGPPEDVPQADIVVELDPGTHVFSLIHADRAEPDLVRTVAPGAVVSIALDVSPPTPVQRRMLPPIEVVRVREKKRPEWPIFLSLGVGAAGVVTGAVFLDLAVQKRSELRKACPDDQCGAGDRNEIARFGTYSDVATVGFAVGLVGLAAGGYFWFTSRSAGPKPPRAQGVHVEPWIGSRSLGVVGEF
jgi:hypothetical protein